MTDTREQTSSATRGYALPVRLLHWVMAAMMIYVIIVGFLMGNGFKVGAHYDYHRATGFAIMILIVIRLGFRLACKPPNPRHLDVSKGQLLAIRAVHSSLYVLMFLQPLLGWYATNAWGVAKIPFFFGLTLPRIVEKDRALGNMLLEVHHYVGLLITALVLLHIAGVAYHHFVLKDRLIRRMI